MADGQATVCRVCGEQRAILPVWNRCRNCDDRAKASALESWQRQRCIVLCGYVRARRDRVALADLRELLGELGHSTLARRYAR